MKQTKSLQKRKKVNKNHRKVSGLFLAPSLLGVLIFFVLPFLVVIYYSFVENPISKRFVGLTNYINVLHNSAFRTAVGNTLLFSLIAVPLAVILGMMLGSFYAIVMGPTTLDSPKAPLSINNFHIIAMIAGVALVLGMQWIKERSIDKAK